MKVINTTVRLGEKTLERIKALVGPYRMAAFIREAVEEELKRRESAAKERDR